MIEQQVIQTAQAGYPIWSLNVSDQTYNYGNDIKPWLRSSDLKNIKDGSLEHYSRTRLIERKEDEKPDKDALFAGHFIEDWLAGNSTEKYLIFDTADRPDPEMTMNAKENKNWKADLQQKCIDEKLIWIEKSEIEFVNRIQFTPTQQTVRNWIQSSDQQVTCLWTDQQTGVKLRSRTDFSGRAHGGNLIIDCKSTAKGTLSEFMYQMKKLSYPLQAQLQIEGMQRTGYFTGAVQYFWFVISKKWPFNVFLIEYTEETQARDKAMFREALAGHLRVGRRLFDCGIEGY